MGSAIRDHSALAVPAAAKRRDPIEPWLLSRMAGWAVLLAVLKRAVPLRSLVRMVLARSDRGGRRPAQERVIVRHARLATRLTPWTRRGKCVERGLITFRYLAAIDARPSLVVGMGRDETSAIIGHAWVVVDGEAVGETVTALEAFTPILTFGPEGRPTDPPSSPADALESAVAAIVGGNFSGDVRFADDASRLVSCARRHGVAALVADRLADRRELPVSLRHALAEEARLETITDLVREPELGRMLDAFAAAGVDALLVKGAQLAYTVYPRPELRERLDTDVLIPRATRDRAHKTLTDLGYVANASVSGELAIPQQSYAKLADGVQVHAVDVHWRIACPQAFAHVVDYGELWASSRPIPRLGKNARGPGAMHALLIACVHRVAHHRDRDEMKWLYDIHLLAPTLSSDEWTALAVVARDRAVMQVVAGSLRRANERFPSAPLTAVLHRPEWEQETGTEPSARYLRRHTRAGQLLDDLGQLDGAARLRLLKEHLFPSRDYMKNTYRPASRMPLPLLYLYRIVRGADRWLRRDGY